LTYQPPTSSTFLSEQISHKQPANSTFLSQQTSTSQTNRLTIYIFSAVQEHIDILVKIHHLAMQHLQLDIQI
jgi:hypothetical protein